MTASYHCRVGFGWGQQFEVLAIQREVRRLGLTMEPLRWAKVNEPVSGDDIRVSGDEEPLGRFIKFMRAHGYDDRAEDDPTKEGNPTKED